MTAFFHGVFAGVAPPVADPFCGVAGKAGNVSGTLNGVEEVLGKDLNQSVISELCSLERHVNRV